MSTPILSTIYSGDITNGLITVRVDPALVKGRVLGEPIAVIFDPQPPEPDPLADHPQLPL